MIPGQQHGLSAGLTERAVSALVLACVLAAIAFGWFHRADSWIDPERGFGYALGIIGGSMMLLLLAYPLRKRSGRRSRAVGSVGFWFRFHMLLGLLGPLAILFHSRFTFGALNSGVALGAMIVVASSGLIGRFFYSRVHRGYSDRKLELRALKQEMADVLASLDVKGIAREHVIGQLQTFESAAIAAGGAFWPSASAVVGLGVRSRFAQRRLSREIGPPRLADLAGDDMQTAQETLRHFFRAVRRAGEFAFYDRLLRLWHLLHLPLFFLLVAAVVLHIVAVHMY